jgi:hypothetical protein
LEHSIFGTVTCFVDEEVQPAATVSVRRGNSRLEQKAAIDGSYYFDDLPGDQEYEVLIRFKVKPRMWPQLPHRATQ